VETTKLKMMHLEIMKEIKMGLSTEFQQFITESSSNCKSQQEKKVTNCIKWCLEKMEHILDIKVVPPQGLYITSRIVQTLINDRESIIVPNKTNQISA
jgi:tRNA A37 threonylcarbamoyladenosine dehydratase